MASVRIPYTAEQKAKNAETSVRVAARKAALAAGDRDEVNLSNAVHGLVRLLHAARAAAQDTLAEALTKEIDRHGWVAQPFAKGGIRIALRDVTLADLDPKLIEALRKRPPPAPGAGEITPVKSQPAG